MRARGMLAMLLVVAGAAGPARAEGYDSAVVRAAAARDRALETGSAHDWQEALELFTAAVELDPTADAKFEFAEAARHLSFEDEAYAAYEDALGLGLSGRAAERAQAFVAEHQRAFGRLEIAGVEGARVYVDGRLRGRLPLARALPVMPGTRRLELDAADHEPFERELSIDADRTLPVTAAQALKRPLPSAADPTPMAPRREAATPPRGNGWALPVLVGGGGLVVLGAATIVVSTLALADKHDELGRLCVVMRGDECAATTASNVSAAQSTGNEILALKGARWAGISAAAVGAGALGLGIIGLSSARGGARRASVELRLSTSAAEARVSGAF